MLLQVVVKFYNLTFNIFGQGGQNLFISWLCQSFFFFFHILNLTRVLIIFVTSIKIEMFLKNSHKWKSLVGFTFLIGSFVWSPSTKTSHSKSSFILLGNVERFPLSSSPMPIGTLALVRSPTATTTILLLF